MTQADPEPTQPNPVVPISISQEHRNGTGLFKRDGLGYRWDVDKYGVVMRADRIANRWNELVAEVSVELRDRSQPLHIATFNLSRTRDRDELVGKLESKTHNLGFPWERLVENFCVGVLRMERLGDPTQYTGQRLQRIGPRYLVDNLIIANKTNMLFAPGGSGKGFLSVALCCAFMAKRGIGDLQVMEAKPVYFDWEDDFEIFEDRVNLVARGMGIEVPRIPYRRMRGVAADRVNEMARVVMEEGADFGVIDSFSAAGGTLQGNASWDTIAHRLFDAVDQIPIAWWIIDHVSAENVKAPVGKAFGSIQKENRVRNAWEMRSKQEPDSPTVHMQFFHAKWNHTGKKKPFGLSMTFTDDRVVFESEDPATQTVNRSLADRMVTALQTEGPMDTATLARKLYCAQSSIRSELARSKEQFARDERDRVTLRGLVERVDPDEPSEEDTELPWR